MNTALRCTTSATAGNGLGTTTKYLRRATSVATGNGLGTTLSYLRGAASNDRAQRSSSFGAQIAPPRATAWAPRYINTALRYTTSAAAVNGLGITIKYVRRTTSDAAVNGRAQNNVIGLRD